MEWVSSTGVIKIRRILFLSGFLGWVGLLILMPGCEKPGIGYVGKEVCLQCHNGVQAPDKSEFTTSYHSELQCENCHGPGALHVRNGGRYGLFVEGATIARERCDRCHDGEVNQFQKSGHARKAVLDCTGCHDPHSADTTRRTTNDNQLCLQCHTYRGFDTEEAIKGHTFHGYDPVVTGQSRCIACHMVPLQRREQAKGPHQHSLKSVPPITSNTGTDTPALPNSCAGITGCHDGSVSTAPVFNVDDPQGNERLQILFNMRYGASDTKNS